jgi:hypothetical protein
LFPVEVKRVLEEADLPVPMPEHAGAYRPPSYAPELHVLDGEWYFTEASTAILADLSAAKTGASSLLLGTPTVAARLTGSAVLLVDRCPFLEARFPQLSVPIEVADVTAARIDPGYKIVLLDPPWYKNDLFAWLTLARRALASEGRIIFPLFGELTRPGADRERHEILEFVESAGRVEVLNHAIQYDIPLFEERALSAHGIVLDRPWRRADLVIVHARRPFAHSTAGRPALDNSDTWSTYVIGRQLIKLRKSPRPGHNGLIGAVPGLNGNQYGSVSLRDARRRYIDLWTSRNRVARVMDPAAVERALRCLSGGEEGLRARARRLLASGGTRLQQLLELLEVEP